MTEPAQDLAPQNESHDLQTLDQNMFGSLNAFEDAQRVAKMYSAADLIPSTFKNNIPNTLIALEMAVRMQASPMAIMQELYIVHGKPSFSSKFLIGLVNNSKIINGRLQFIYNDDRTSCYALGVSRETGEPLRGTTITMEMATAEKWVSRSGSKWVTMPEQMLMYRAASFWAKAYAPDLMLGMMTTDEVQDITIIDDTPSANDILNKEKASAASGAAGDS